MIDALMQRTASLIMVLVEARGNPLEVPERFGAGRRLVDDDPARVIRVEHSVSAARQLGEDRRLSGPGHSRDEHDAARSACEIGCFSVLGHRAASVE